MKRLLTLFLLVLTFTLNAQFDTPPTGVNFINIPTYSFKRYNVDTTLWIYEGLGKWQNLSKSKDLRFYRLLNNHDSLSTLQEKSYHSLIDTPNLDLKANVASPTFTGTVTIPALNIPTSAAVNYFWQCTNASTGAGAWTAISASQLYKGTVDGDDGKPNGGTALIDGTGTAGWYYVCIDAGSYDYGNPNGNSITLALNDQIHYNGTIWQKVPAGNSQWVTSGSDIYYNTGKVLIGTTTAGQLLTLNSSSANSAVSFSLSDIAKGYTGAAYGTNSLINGSSAGDFAIRTEGGKMLFSADAGNTIAMTILTGHNVGIGTSAPAQKLAVNGEIGILNGNNFVQYISGNSHYWNPHPSSTNYAWSYDAANKMTLSSAGNLEAAGTITAAGGVGYNSGNWKTAYDHSQIAGGTGVHVSDAERTTWNAKEPALGNPGTSGFILSSTTGGTRSWVAQTSMTYPGAGIALSNGSAWSGSITNNSANWNTAYGWGNHASAGYAVLNSSPTFTGTVTATNFILSSDKRLKENISYIKNISKFDDIKFVQFNLKSEPGILRYGVIAQDIEKVAPELVRTDSTGIKSVAYIDLLCGEVAYLERSNNRLMIFWLISSSVLLIVIFRIIYESKK